MLLFLLCFIFNTVSDNLATISLGNEQNQIGFDINSDEIWFPFLFDVDSYENFYIPDFYNNRIAVFSSHGKYIKSIYTSSISPRINYFKLLDSGDFIIFNDYTFYLIDSEGIEKESRFLGIGIIPSIIECDEDFIYFQIDNGIFKMDYYFNHIILDNYEFKNNYINSIGEKQKALTVVLGPNKMIYYNLIKDKIIKFFRVTD